jgi:hypothetical protein
MKTVVSDVGARAVGPSYGSSSRCIRGWPARCCAIPTKFEAGGELIFTDVSIRHQPTADERAAILTDPGSAAPFLRSDGHSGQVSPIESRTSAIATAPASGERPASGSWRANSIARARADPRSPASSRGAHIRGSRLPPAAPLSPIHVASGSQSASPRSSASRSILRAGRILEALESFRLLTQGGDPKSLKQALFHVFRRPMQKHNDPVFPVCAGHDDPQPAKLRAEIEYRAKSAEGR